MNTVNLTFTLPEWEALHEMICASDRQGVIDALNAALGSQCFMRDPKGNPMSSAMRPVDAQRRLFSDRVPV